MESFWNKTYTNSYPSLICDLLRNNFSDVSFYPEVTHLDSPSVAVIQSEKREAKEFMNGTVVESFFFKFIVPYGIEDENMINGCYWLLEQCLLICESTTTFNIPDPKTTFIRFVRSKNPSKELRTSKGYDWFSAEIKMTVERRL